MQTALPHYQELVALGVVSRGRVHSQIGFIPVRSHAGDAEIIRRDFTRADCGAYTYNAQSAACFLKSGMGETAQYSGAVSADIKDRSAALLAAAEAQAARLDFLYETDIASAERRATDLPHEFRVGGWNAQDLAEWSREAEADANLVSALRYMAGATVLSDAAGDWIDYARLSNAAALATEDSGDKRAYFDQALDAAIAGYLRSQGGPQEANALIEMATALENLDRGRASIPALRLAQAVSPRDDTAAALDRALGLFGFRVTDTSVDSDAASPRICAEFSEALVAAGVDYAPFVLSLIHI